MGLSAKAVQELESERERLLAEKRQIDEALTGIDALLRLAGASEAVAVADRPESPTSVAELGLRDAIRTVLRWSQGPRKPIEITERLRSLSYPETGKTELSLRVSNELYRMASTENSEVQRSGKGRYRLVATGG